MGTSEIYGVNFSRFSPGVPIFVPTAESFHGNANSQGLGTGDYDQLALGESDNFHSGFRDQVLDNLPAPANTITTGQFVPRVAAVNLIQLSCFMYDTKQGVFASSTPGTGPGAQSPNLPLADPANRAATLIHEAWHAWEDQYGLSIGTGCGHTNCPGDHGIGNASCGSGSECDIWYPHPIGACPDGSFFPQELNGVELPFSNIGLAITECNDALTSSAPNYDSGYMYGLMHRPYQTENELMCDISNTPTGWVPLIVRELAASNADYFETNNSVSATPNPNPAFNGFGLAAVQPACYALNSRQKYAACTNGTQCDGSLPCTAPGTICNPQSGCCQAETVNCTVPFSANCTATNPVCAGCDFATNCCPPNPPPK
jgi:hypothetical protein